MAEKDGRDLQRDRFFDAHACQWEERNYTPEKLAQVDLMVAGLALSNGMNILDVGCGEGVLQPFLRKHAGKDAQLFALDASKIMLESVSTRFPDVQTFHAKAESMPLPDASIDVLICFSAFPHFSDKPAAVKEFYRVLKHGGRAYVLHIDGREKLNALHDKHHAVEGDHLPCPTGMRLLFLEAGFALTNADETANHYYFFAIK